jgi:hypothetical protein
MSDHAKLRVPREGSYTDASGTWITDADGWTRREKDGQPWFIRCGFCDGPVDRVKGEWGTCEPCTEAFYEAEQ